MNIKYQIQHERTQKFANLYSDREILIFKQTYI